MIIIGPLLLLISSVFWIVFRIFKKTRKIQFSLVFNWISTFFAGFMVSMVLVVFGYLVVCALPLLVFDYRIKIDSNTLVYLWLIISALISLIWTYKESNGFKEEVEDDSLKKWEK
jgi:hypothetical protein